MPRKIILLVNPAAANGRALRLLDPVVRRLRAGGTQVTVARGADPADAARVARKLVATRPEALVALGGDGIVHAAVQAVAGTGVPLGVVPAGTGNDIARAFGIPRRDVSAAVDIVLAGRTRPVDAVRCTGERFAGVLACGFDARVNERANRMGHVRGIPRYLLALAAELRVFRPIPFVLEADGEERRVEAMFVAVGNTSMYGAGMRICPQARPDDGLLDVVIVRRIPRRELLRVFPRVYRGSHLRHPAVTLLRARTVSLAAPDVTAYADGERLAPLPITCTVEPGVVEMLVP